MLDPKKGKLAEQVECLRLLTSEFGPDLPIIQTIFSPMSQAKNLVGPHELPIYLRRFPEQLETGLKTITATTLRFIDECRQTGIAGIFYAVQHAQYGILSETEFERFEKPYDLQILAATRDLWLNLLHLHGEELMFSQVLDYPAQIINWHDRQTAPSLAEAQKLFKGVACGGLRQWETMVLGTPDEVRAEARDAIAQTGGRRFILGTGCVLPITAPHGNVMAAKQLIAESARD
jgi:uroporphyrinogen decarboxylase